MLNLFQHLPLNFKGFTFSKSFFVFNSNIINSLLRALDLQQISLFLNKHIIPITH